MNSNHLRLINKCRICKSNDLIEFLSLGPAPLPNAFLTKSDFKSEMFYPLEVVFCQNCSLVQLKHVVKPQTMFSNYFYIPSTSRVMLNNFTNLAYEANCLLKLNKNKFVLDIGSNDGSLLEIFKKLGVKVVGVDPAKNLAKVANLKQIPTEMGLFNPKMSQKILKKYGLVDLITATNVIAHIDNLDQVFKSISLILKPNGVFICEFPYLLDLITKNQFDTIYHEHLSYFSLKPWQLLTGKYGFQIIGAKRLQIHGGSIRLTHRKLKVQSEKFKVIKTVQYLLDLERQNKLNQPDTYLDFAKRVTALKTDLKRNLLDLKSKGKKIIGLGAAAKGSILTNYFGIGPKILDFITDSTPIKHGLFTPGQHIPILSEENIQKQKADYALILAWNFSSEIMRKHKHFKSAGGKFIIPIPEVKIV